MEQIELTCPCDASAWRVVSVTSPLAIWPDEQTALAVPTDASDEVRAKMTEHVEMIHEMRQKLADRARTRFTLAELECLWGQYTVERVETGKGFASRDIHDAFTKQWRARRGLPTRG